MSTLHRALGCSLLDASKTNGETTTEMEGFRLPHIRTGVTALLMLPKAALPSSSLKQRSVSSTGLSFSFSDACSGEGERLEGGRWRWGRSKRSRGEERANRREGCREWERRVRGQYFHKRQAFLGKTSLCFDCWDVFVTGSSCVGCSYA